MLPWLRLNASRGKFGDRQIIKAATLADIHSPQMATGVSVERADVSQSTYCLGWGIETYRGHRLLAHGGGIDGFITQVAILPDDGLGVVVFANMDGTSSCTVVLKHAIDRVLALPPGDWRGEMLTKLKKGKEAQKEAKANKSADRKAGTTPSHALADYAGEFEHDGYGHLQIKMRDEKLAAEFNGMSASLEHWHYDVFNSVEGSSDDFLANHKFNFATDLDGNIASVAVNLEEAVDPITFKRQIDPRFFDTNYLARFVGQFDLSGFILNIVVAGTALKVTIPGEPQFALVPKIDGSFGVKDHSEFVFRFVTDAEDHVNAVRIRRPGGTVNAPRKI